METVERSSAAEVSTTYDGFISYSHAADGLLAPRLQSGLQRFAKPWWKRRALRIFRDESSLSANPHLWSSITEALDSSEWFVLLLSPDAAASPWVNQEIEYWKENRDPSRILPVLTKGTFEWSDGDVAGSAVPEQLQGSFTEEPRWVDMRFARNETDLDLKDPRFADAVADIASALRGVPKDELASEEVTQHRRTIRTAWAAGAVVLLLGIAAIVFAIQSNTNAELAKRNEQMAKSRELAAASIRNLSRDPELATLLALTALDTAPVSDEPPVELINAIWQAGSTNRLVGVIPTDGDKFATSPDGGRIAIVESNNRLSVRDTETYDIVWEYEEETQDEFVVPALSGDGRIALPIYDEGDDGAPNRIVVLDAVGSVEATLEFPDCIAAGISAWSADERFLAVGAPEVCERDGAPQWLEVFETTGWTSVAFLPLEGRGDQGLLPRFDTQGRLYGMRTFEPTAIFEAETYSLVEISEATGIGDVAPDGSLLFGSHTLQGDRGSAGTPFSVLSFDSETGEVTDILYTGIRYPSVPHGVIASSDGRYVIVALDQEILVFDPATGEERFRIPSGAEIVAFDTKAELLYTDGEDGISVWNLGAAASGVTSTADLERFTWVNANSFSVRGDVGIAAAADIGEGDWRAIVFDPSSGKPLNDFDGFIPDKVLANGRVLGSIVGFESAADAIVDPTTGKLSRFFECTVFDSDGRCDEPRHHFALTLEGNELFSFPIDDDGSLVGEMHVLDVDTGETLNVESSPYGDRWVDAIADSWVFGSPTRSIDHWVWDRATGDDIWHDEQGHLRFEIGPDGRRIATWSAESLQFVDTETWSDIQLEGFNDIRGGSFNSDGTLFALGDADSLYVIDVESGLIAQQARLPGVSDVHFIDDENLVIGTNTGVFGTLSISTESLIERSRDGLRRSFTAQECLTYRIDPCPTLDEMRGG